MEFARRSTAENGGFPRRCERCCNVDIGSAPSYLSFDLASRSDFWTFLIGEAALSTPLAD
jgi:hypothetical protein